MKKENEVIKINGMKFSSKTGEMLSNKEDELDCSPEFSGVKNGKVYVCNKLTPIDVKKFQSLPVSIQERILKYPYSDYTRDVLSEAAGTILEDTFPNFKNLSYTAEGAAIIMNDSNGTPVRTPFLLN